MAESRNTPLQEEQVPLKSRSSVSLADAAVQIMQKLIAGGALTYFSPAYTVSARTWLASSGSYSASGMP